MTPATFETLIMKLREFWRQQGCTELCGYDLPMGAGTYHPATVFGVLGADPRSLCYVQPSRRPQDGRYGESSNRMYQHHQFQVMLKPAPEDAQKLAYQSLEYVGIDIKAHDIKFIENNWESPVLGASGVGWEVWCDGMEILQYTYFERMGGLQLPTIPVEYAYGLERIVLILADSQDIGKTQWSSGVSYDAVRFDHECALSRYSFEDLNLERSRAKLASQCVECRELIEKQNWLAAYEAFLLGVHEFNVLHAYGALGQTERAELVLQLHELAGRCCELYLEAHVARGRIEFAQQ